jgi:hypothetical protein
MKRFDPQVGIKGRGMSASETHRSLKRLLRNAAAISLFATGALHQIQTVKATDWSYDFANSVYSMTSQTAIPNNTNTTWNSASEPTGAPTVYTRSSTSSNPLGYGIQVVNGGDTNLGSGGEVNLFGGITASGTFFSLNDLQRLINNFHYLFLSHFMMFN